MDANAVYAFPLRQGRAVIIVTLATRDDMDVHTTIGEMKGKICQYLARSGMIGKEKSIKKNNFQVATSPALSRKQYLVNHHNYENKEAARSTVLEKSRANCFTLPCDSTHANDWSC